MIDPSFWRGRRVFLTGHTGFKGSWLSLWLNSLGADVTGYALAPPTQPSLFETAGAAEGIDHHLGDVNDGEQLTSVIRNAQPEVVFHLAAQPLVRESYTDPAATWQTNVIGTVNLLQACRRVESLRAIVIITTDKCYENREWLWGYRENEALGGHDPYSSSKAGAELAAASWRRSFFNPAEYGQTHQVSLATARAGNVIGGGDWAADRLVPDLARAVDRGEAVDIRYPDARRPWQHVLEPLSGYLLLAQKMTLNGAEYGEAWNFGPDTGGNATVRMIVDLVAQKWGKGRWRDVSEANHPHEAAVLNLDITKAREKLGWRPSLSIDETVAMTVKWYAAYYDDRLDSTRPLTLSQIKEYSEVLTDQKEGQWESYTPK